MRLGLRPQERPPRSGYDFDKNYFYMCILENLDMFLVFFSDNRIRKNIFVLLQRILYS